MIEGLPGLVASGRIVDVVLGLVVLEAAVLALALRRRRGPRLSAILANLAAGAALLLALRAALKGDGWTAVATFLLVALVAHLADLALRFRDRSVR